MHDNSQPQLKHAKACIGYSTQTGQHERCKRECCPAGYCNIFVGYLQSNLVTMNSTGPSKKVHIKRNFTLTVARCMGVIIPGDFKVVHIKRYFTLNVFILTRFHCIGKWHV